MIKHKNLSLEEIAGLLQSGKKIIALVKNGAHYVLVTGIDNEKIYLLAIERRSDTTYG